MCIRDRYQVGYENGYNKNTVIKIENKIKYKIKTEQLRINQTEQHINNNNNNSKISDLLCNPVN